MKKIAFTSSGTALIREAGSTRRATEAEVGAYLKTLVPAKKAGGNLDAVKYDGGFVFARYDNGKVFKKRIAQNNSTQQQEPVNSGDKADPDLKTPRSKKHSKPETKEVTKDRPDVANPTEIRNSEYTRGGDGGADEHKDGIPRSKKNSGLEGSSKTTFDEEKANKATSGNPDTYVQDLYDQTDPTPAGNADNHATAGANTASASDGLRVESESTIYQKIKIAEEEKKDGKPMPPWLKDKKDKGGDNDDEDDGEKDGEESDDDDEDSKKEAKLVQELKTKIAEQDKTITALKKEASRYKVREARQNSALKLALAYRDANPEQFPNVEAVADKAIELCKAMNSEALESTYEQVKAIRIANSKQRQVVKTASVDEGVQTAFSTPMESISELNSGKDVDSLREALMSKSALGKKVAEMDAYHNSLANG